MFCLFVSLTTYRAALFPAVDSSLLFWTLYFPLFIMFNLIASMFFFCAREFIEYPDWFACSLNAAFGRGHLYQGPSVSFWHPAFLRADFSCGRPCSLLWARFSWHHGRDMAQALEALQWTWYVRVVGSFGRGGLAFCALPWGRRLSESTVFAACGSGSASWRTDSHVAWFFGTVERIWETVM